MSGTEVVIDNHLARECDSRPWRATAAYLHVLHLDQAGLAWEYLRRSPEYRRAWRSRSVEPAKSEHWGLAAWEDPEFDARAAAPRWAVAEDAAIAVTGLDCTGSGPEALSLERFSLWQLPGRKVLHAHGGATLIVALELSGRTLRLALTGNVEEGVPFAYLLPAGPAIDSRWRQVQRLRASIADHPAQGRSRSAARPNRTALTHLRCLQAFDAVTAGASQRQLATVIFGSDRVAAHWTPDGELRAQIRYLIRRARALVRGGYRQLLDVLCSRTGRVSVPRKSPCLAR